MKAVILAAGKGKRIRKGINTQSKPLTKLLGLTLIERTILSAKKAGIKEFIIVLGYRGELIKEKLGNGEKYDVRIHYVYNKDYHLDNGLSVLAARTLVSEPFILLMADHLVSPEIIRKAIETPLHSGECLLCVDKNPEPYIDLEDATKVLANQNDLLINIGKNLREYNAIDTGVFKCSPAIFLALEKAVKKGKAKLSDGIREIAARGKMRVLDISGHFWLDVDTKKSYKLAKKLLCKSLKKPSDGPIARIINRPISVQLTKLLVKTNITPNMISIISFLLMLASAGLFALGKYWSIITAGLVAQFASILDGCDGEIARLKFMSSEFGGWFDSVLDRYADGALMLGIMYGYWYNHADPVIWLIGITALIGSFMNSYTATKYDALFAKKDKPMKFRMGRDIRTFIIMVGAIANQLLYTLAVLAVITNLAVAIRIIKVFATTKPKEKLEQQKVQIVSDTTVT